MKRTHIEVEKIEGGQTRVTSIKITCEVTGEMEDGTKVWTKLDDNGKLLLDEQYFLGRFLGKYYFIHA